MSATGHHATPVRGSQGPTGASQGIPRAIGYRRVSTEAQLDGFGLELQDDALTATATQLGLELAGVYTDEGISGSEDLSGRAGLAAALDDLAENPGTTLVVPRLDRLARDLMLQESVLADVWRAGGQVVSCSETERAYCVPDNPDDPARTLIRQVLGAVAAYERSMIRLRLRAGRRRRLARTGWAGGPLPYGGMPGEAEVLARIYARRAEGRSWQAIADELNAAGLRKRSGGTWARPELWRVVKRADERVGALDSA